MILSRAHRAHDRKRDLSDRRQILRSRFAPLTGPSRKKRGMQNGKAHFGRGFPFANATLIHTRYVRIHSAHLRGLKNSCGRFQVLRLHWGCSSFLRTFSDVKELADNRNLTHVRTDKTSNGFFQREEPTIDGRLRRLVLRSRQRSPRRRSASVEPVLDSLRAANRPFHCRPCW